MTKEKIKTALKSILKAIKVMLIILFILTLPFTIKSIPFIIDQIQEKYAAQQHFEEVCKFVKENEKTFIEFSDYNVSLLNDASPTINIERNGELQEMRDVIFKYFSSASAGFSTDGNTIARYEVQYHSYKIILVCSKDIGKKQIDDRWDQNINNNMKIWMYKTGF